MSVWYNPELDKLIVEYGWGNAVILTKISRRKPFIKEDWYYYIGEFD